MAREMKDSGVEWIDLIPTAWKVQSLKSLFAFGKGLPITKENLIESGVSVISYGQIHSKENPGTRITPGLIRCVSPAFLDSNANSLVNAGDFIFADTSEDLSGCGNCVYVDTQVELFAGYHTIVFQAKESKDNKYFAYLFLSDAWRKQIREKVSGVKLFSISQRILGSIGVIVPPLDEQRQISTNLDRECAEIDAVLTKTRASIEEYKKLKQAVITQAVTKGVRGDRPMKDSGSEWIGSIPANWTAKRIKYLFTIKKDIAGTEGYMVLSITQRGIIPKDLSKNEGQLAENYSKYQVVESGDYAMNHMDLLTGWVDISKYSGVTSPDYRVFVLNDEEQNDKEYYLYLMQMCYFNRIFYGLGAGVSGMGRWRLQSDKFLNFLVAVPPCDEQREIALYLDEHCAHIDALISKKEQLLTELERYKKALIFEYVSGKKEVAAQAQPITDTITVVGVLDLQSALITYQVIRLLGRHLDGRVKLQKAKYLIEHELNIRTGVRYIRAKHGPYDLRLKEYERILQGRGWITVHEGASVKYIQTAQFEDGQAEYLKLFSAQHAGIRRIIHFLRDMNTSECERVATLFAAWNDFIIRGTANPTDDQIITDVTTNWTDNKKNPKYSTWQSTLDKMKKASIIPHGFGELTSKAKPDS